MSIKEKSWCKIPLKSLVPADWNYKGDDENKVKKLKNNMKRNGQIENIIVRKLETGFYEVVNGNHRLQVFEEAGITEPVCYNLGNISDSTAKRIAVETNETKFDTDSFKLSNLLSEILDDGEYTMTELVQTMPYNLIELEQMLELNNDDFDFENTGGNNEDGSGSSEKPEYKIVCPKCGHKIPHKEAKIEKN